MIEDQINWVLDAFRAKFGGENLTKRPHRYTPWFLWILVLVIAPLGTKDRVGISRSIWATAFPTTVSILDKRVSFALQLLQSIFLLLFPA